MNKERVVWIDYARVLVIFLVVLCHTPIPHLLNAYIYYLTIPFFFWCSGYLFNPQREGDTKSFILRKIKHIIVPYFIFHFITYLFWVFFDRNYGEDVSMNYPFYEPILDIFLGNCAVNCIPLWFIPALFVTELAYFFTSKYASKYRNLIFLLPFVVIVADLFFDYKFPVILSSSLVGIVFFHIGCKDNQKIKMFGGSSALLKIVLLIALSAVLSAVVYYNGKTAMHVSKYNNYGLFFLGAASAISLVIIVLSNINKRHKLVEFISSNLIIVVALHLIVGKVIKAFSFFILKYPLSIYEDKIFLNIGFSIVSMIILLPIIWVINRYFPFILGRK